MTSEEANLLEPGPWDDLPGIFMPSQILDLSFTIMPDPPPNIEKLITILAWTRLDETRERVTSYKYLGVLITSTLSWSPHITNVCKRARQQLGIVYR